MSFEKSLIGFTYSAVDPASRFRFMQFIPHLVSAGWAVVHRPRRPPTPWRLPLEHLPVWSKMKRFLEHHVRHHYRRRDLQQAGGFSAVFLNRDFLDWDCRWEQRLHQRNPRILFDFDDAIFLNGKSAHVAWMCQHAAWITPGNQALADFAGQFSDRVTVFPTVIDTSTCQATAPSTQEPLRIGWCGSDLSIRQTLFPHLPMLRRLQEQRHFHFVVISRPRPTLPPDSPVWQFTRWSPTVETRLGDFFDVGIMPLVDDEYQRGKCGAKLLQYMACGLPVIAAPLGVNAEIVTPDTGFLAASETDWANALRQLQANREQACAMGAAGRRRCETRYALSRWFPELLAILDRVRRFTPAAGQHR